MEKLRLQKLGTLEAFLKKIEDCQDCNFNPAVFISEEKFPICDVHWGALADSNIEWPPLRKSLVSWQKRAFEKNS